MTLKDLSQLYYLTQEIKANQRQLEKLKDEREREEQRLYQMRASADGVASPSFEGLPRGTSMGSKLETSVLKIVDQEQLVRAKHDEIVNLEIIISQRQCLLLSERVRLERYIDSIEDSLTRQIFRARFVYVQAWDQVADAVGSETSDRVKKICYRYLRRHTEDDT